MKIYEEWIEEHPFDKGKGWANEPWCQEEMELTDEVVSAAAACSGSRWERRVARDLSCSFSKSTSPSCFGD